MKPKCSASSPITSSSKNASTSEPERAQNPPSTQNSSTDGSKIHCPVKFSNSQHPPSPMPSSTPIPSLPPVASYNSAALTSPSVVKHDTASRNAASPKPSNSSPSPRANDNTSSSSPTSSASSTSTSSPEPSS